MIPHHLILNAFEKSAVGFLVADEAGRITYANSAFSRIAGIPFSALRDSSVHSALIQLRESRNLSSEKWDPVSKFLQSKNESEPIKVLLEFRSGEHDRSYQFSVSPLWENGEFGGHFVEIQECTTEKLLKEGLRQAQKMEAVGRLSMGIAHDFNNLLTGINGNLAIFEMEARSQKQKITGWENFHFATKAGQRAGELVKQLLGFSRSECTDLDSFCANDVVSEVRGIMKASLPANIELENTLCDSLWHIMGDSNMISQVLINMATNARDALKKSGGLISFHTDNQTVSETEAGKTASAKSGDFVRITVQDNGEGMPPEVKAKIFEPFFTTKEKGKGTGLGLATSVELIRQHGGWVTVESEKGIGTKFEIYLPRGPEKQKQKSVPEFQPAVVRENESPSETILVVDDEEAVRNVAVVILRKMGYQVIPAEDGVHALEIFEEKGSEIDLVLLDLSMPRMSGQETFLQLRERFDFVPVLICSGMLLDVTAFEKETGGCPDGFVQKPYQIQGLTSIIRETIDRVSAESGNTAPVKIG